MNVPFPSSRFSVLLLTTSLVLCSTVSQSAFGQAVRRGQGKSNAVKKTQQLNGISTIKGQAKLRAKTAFQTNGKRIVKQKALQNGFSKQQVIDHKPQVKNKLQNHFKQEAADRAHLWFANQGSELVRHKITQQNLAPSKLLAIHPALKQRCNRIQYLRQPGNQRFRWSWRKWCGYYPTCCHWWYSYCGPVYYFDPTCTLTYDWYNYYVCPVEVQSLVFAPEVRWALGLKCVLIPGKGLGIEAVKPDSPAELAGLEPGMIIISANGMAIIDESSMAIAIDQSGGVLQLDVLGSANGQPARHTVLLQPVLGF